MAGPAAVLGKLLRAQAARTDYLGTALDRVAAAAPVLNAWSENAVELYGLARLATSLRADLAELASLPRRTTINPVMQDFRGQADTHYLYMCMVVHGPAQQRYRDWINVLRAWLLVQALKRAHHGAWLDDLLRDACLRVREACQETEVFRWLPAIEQLRVRSDDWYRLTHHLHNAVDRFVQAPGEKEYAQRREWLLLLRRIAAGESKPQKVEWVTREAFPDDTLDLLPLELLGTENESADEPVLVGQAVGTEGWDDADQDDEFGADVVAVDATEPPALAAAAIRQVQLLSGADARLLAWDWFGLTPPEQSALEDLICRSLRCDAPQDRLFAALVDVGVSIGRSLEMVGRMRVRRSTATGSDAEWTLDLSNAVVRRTSPRRAAHWRPDEREHPFVRAFENVLIRQLRSETAQVLRDAAAAAPHATTIEELWQALHPGLLESQFRKWCSAEPALRRVTQGMLSQSLARSVFEDTGDHVAARLLASAPRSGLPASTAYTAYRSSDLPPAFAGEMPDVVNSNVAGGLLDPVDDFLRSGFARAHAELVSQRGTPDFIKFHNAVTHYWDAVWRAATGIRPYSLRWTDSGLVDPSGRFVVIDDKASLQDSRTRLVPLPAGLWERFERSYLQEHLPKLQRWLEANGALVGTSIALDRATDRQPRPLMFALSTDASSIRAVPIASHAESTPAESPLPANVYRHRLRTSLHRRGVDTEVIDSIMGHQDGAGATHGDYSMRVWLDDMLGAAPALRDAFDELDIQQPPTYAGEATWRKCAADLTYRPLLPERTDATSRSGSSWRLWMRAARTARSVITQAVISASEEKQPSQKELAKRLADLHPDVLNTLSARLATSVKGTPTALGPLRYGYFLRLCDRAWQHSNKRPDLRRRFAWRPRDASPYRAEAAKASLVRGLLEEQLEVAMQGLHPSTLTQGDAVWLALLDLGLCSRVADPDLQWVLMERKAIRLIELDGRAYLEWNADGEVSTARSSIQRLPLTSRAAHALHRMTQAERWTVDWESSLPRRFGALEQTLQEHGLLERSSFGGALAALNIVVDQCNAIELPGTAAAYLGGRLRSTSLHWGDKLALRNGHRFEVEALIADPSTSAATSGAICASEDDSGVEPYERRAVALTVATAAGRAQAQIDVRDLFKKVRAELEQARYGIDGTDGKKPARKSVQRMVAALAPANGPTAVAALVHWCASLVVRPRGRGVLAISTVQRYFAALSPLFEVAAYQVDLLSMDDEEIAELYGTLMTLPTKAGAEYSYARLREFHAFCEQRFSIPAIDWSEVVPQKTTKLSAPGYVHERLYRHLLIDIRRCASLETAYLRAAAQALVVLAYRFGLRGSEALGLQVDDCHLDATPPWISVQKNRLRDLKSPAARRTVPLLTRLRPVERKAIDRLLSGALQATSGLTGAPRYLFLDPQGAGELLDGGLIKRTVNGLIKAVTGQAHLSLHHLRHSFACNAWEGVENAGVLDKAAGGDRLTLLGSRHPGQPTRRAPWAVARALGHAHPRTTLFSYVHILSEVVERLAFRSPPHDWSLPSNLLLQVGRIPPQARPLSQSLTLHDPLSGAQALSMLMELDRGADVDRLPSRYPIGLHAARRVQRIRADVLRRVSADNEAPDANASPRASAYLVPQGILSHVTQSRGRELRAAIERLFTPQARSRLGGIGISEEEFCALFGSKRNISMCRAAQFRLLRAVQEVMEIPPAQLRLAWRLNGKVKRLAESSGWLPPSAPEQLSTPEVEIDKARLDGHAIEYRVVVSLKRSSQGTLRNRWELITALLSAVPLLTFEAERD